MLLSDSKQKEKDILAYEQSDDETKKLPSWQTEIKPYVEKKYKIAFKTYEEWQKSMNIEMK